MLLAELLNFRLTDLLAYIGGALAISVMLPQLVRTSRLKRSHTERTSRRIVRWLWQKVPPARPGLRGGRLLPFLGVKAEIQAKETCHEAQ